MRGGGGGIQSDEGSQDFVPNHRERLGEKISYVPNTWNVLDPELASLHPVLKPVEAHIARFRHLWLDGFVGKAHGDFIVAMNRRGRLRVAKVGEHLSLFVCDLCSGKRAPVLRFLNGRAHHEDARGVNGDGVIRKGGVVATRKMVERPGHAASVGPWSMAGRPSYHCGERRQIQGGGPNRSWSQGRRWSVRWPAHRWR